MPNIIKNIMYLSSSLQHNVISPLTVSIIIIVVVVFHNSINKQLQTVLFLRRDDFRVCGGEIPLQVNVPPGCEVLCFPLTACLLRKMSAVHLQHIRFEITLKTQHENSMFFSRSCWRNKLQNKMCCTLTVWAESRFYSTANRSAEHRLCSIWARLNLQRRQWIINKMSYWLIDLYTRQSGCLFCIHPPSPFQFEPQ